MGSDAADADPDRRLLTLGSVDIVRVQVGYRAVPDGPAYQQFLMDLPVPETSRAVDGGAFDDTWALDALEPVLHDGTGAPRHYSLHVHRWHTSWGPSPGALEIGLLVTAGTRTAALSDAWQNSVAHAFRTLLEVAGGPEATATARDAAILRARRSVATAYGVDREELSLSAEEHHPSENSWTLGLRSRSGDVYDVVVGLVDGYARSVRVRHAEPVEVSDSVGSE